MSKLIKNSSRYIVILFSVIWVCFVFYVYLVNNVAFSPKVNVYIFLAVFLFMLRAFGERIFEYLSVKAERYPSIPKIILDIAMGLGVFNIMIYLISLIINDVSVSVIICLIMLFMLSFSNIYKTFLRLLIIETKINLLNLKKREIFLFAMLVLLFLTVLILSHTPTIDHSILAGEVSLSKQWLLTDTFVLNKPVPPLSLSFYLPFLYFFPDQTIDISIFNAVIMMCVTVMFYFIVFGQGASSRIKSLFGSIIFLSAPLVLYLGTVPGIRPVNLLYFISSIYIIQKLQHNWDNKSQYIMGFFLIFITCSLGLGIIYSFMILIYLILAGFRNSKVLIFFLSSAAIYLTVFIRFPLMIPYTYLGVIRDVNFANIFDLFMFPIEISLFNKFAVNYLPVGPILLILLPFMIFYYIRYLRRMKAIILILLFIIITVFIMFNFKDFLPVYLYLALIATEVIYRIYRSSRFVSFFIIIFMIAVASINMLSLLQYYVTEYEPVNVIFGLENFDDYLSSKLEDYSKYPSIEKMLKKGDILIIDDEFNHFYIDIPYLAIDLENKESKSIIDVLARKGNIFIAKAGNKKSFYNLDFIAEFEGISLFKYHLDE